MRYSLCLYVVAAVYFFRSLVVESMYVSLPMTWRVRERWKRSVFDYLETKYQVTVRELIQEVEEGEMIRRIVQQIAVV